MSWSDKLKTIAAQGLELSKEMAIKAGAAASHAAVEIGQKAAELGGQAASKMQDFGEKCAIVLEIKSLETKSARLAAKLGCEVYACFAEKELQTISADTPEIKTIIDEINLMKKRIEDLNEALNQRQNAKTGDAD